MTVHDCTVSRLPKLLSEREAAEYLRASVGTVQRERRRGRLGYTQIGARIFYTEEQLVAYIDRRSIQPCQENGTTDRGKSASTGCHDGQTAPCGAGPGSTTPLDRQLVHRSAQKILSKRS